VAAGYRRFGAVMESNGQPSAAGHRQVLQHPSIIADTATGGESRGQPAPAAA
jgi:hypothetical protein